MRCYSCQAKAAYAVAANSARSARLRHITGGFRKHIRQMHSSSTRLTVSAKASFVHTDRVYDHVASATGTSASDTPVISLTQKRRPSEFGKILANGPKFEEFVTGTAETSNYDARGLSRPQTRLPEWLKKNSFSTGKQFNQIRRDLQGLKLNTVCQEARCPNIGECWGGSDKSKATATIMLMGDTCTRGCRFCSVKTSRAPPPLDPLEPERTAVAISKWGLGYIVLTSVDRDDIADGGADHFARTIEQVKRRRPGILVEALVGDFRGDEQCVERIAKSGLDVFAHNLETVELLTPYVRDPRAKYRQSLHVLLKAKQFQPSLLTKTSLMLGLGESDEQIVQTLKDLRANNVDIVTFGQYMRPTKKHMKVVEYVRPEKFTEWKEKAESMGFLYCASGPLVRSSYKAGEFFIENLIRRKQQRTGERPALST